MVWNITKDEIRTRMAVVEEATWAPPAVGTPEPPGGNADRKKFSDASGVPVDDMMYSDFIIGGRWDGVDDVLRGVYEEASEKLGREFPYPADQDNQDN